MNKKSKGIITSSRVPYSAHNVPVSMATMAGKIQQRVAEWALTIQLMSHIFTLLCTLLPWIQLGVEKYDNN